MKKVNTTKTLRCVLFETMQGVLDGTVEIKKANTAVKAASGINQSIRFDLEKERLAIKAKRATTKNARVKAIEL